MARKIIKVVVPGEETPTRLDKNFASFAALVRKLTVGQTVTVAVYERETGIDDVLMGYGTVTRTTLSKYTVPKKLNPEY